MQRTRRYWSWTLALLAGAAPACSEELGPERMETTRGTGVVREGGQPVGGGWVECGPVAGTVGDMRPAPVRRAGTFDADRVAVGRNVVGLVQAPIRIRGGKQLFHTFRSLIRRHIPAGSAPGLDIDLVEEVVRY